MEEQGVVETPMASGVWLSAEQAERVRKLLAYLWDTEERHFAEAPEEASDAHIFNDMKALSELLESEARVHESLADDRPVPKLVVHAVERTDDDRIYIGINEMFDVVLKKADEGLVVDIFPWDAKYGCRELLGSTYVYDYEAEDEDESLEVAGGG